MTNREKFLAELRAGVFGPAPSGNGEAFPGDWVKLRRLDVLEMVNTLPPEVPWIAEPLLVRGALTLLYGREGEGKSLLALAIAIAVAAGEEVAGFRPAAGKVLYIDSENSAGEIHRRVRALGLPEGAAERLVIFEAESVDLRKELPQVETVIETERPALTVLDSFRSLWAGEENDSGEVAPVLDALRNMGRRHDTAILLLHHSGKAGSEYRGSSAIGASAELSFHLSREPDDEDPQRRFLACRKSRPSPEPGRRWLRLSTELGLTFVDECEPPAGEAKPAGRPSKVMQALAPDMEEAVRLAGVALTTADLARACGRDAGDGSVRRVLAELVRQGRLERLEDGRYRERQNAKPLKRHGVLALEEEDPGERP